MADKIFHLAVRFLDNLFSVGNVVEKHNEVVSKLGYVWFGKLGQTISQNRIDMLNAQIAKSIPTYAYLVKGNRKKSTFYRAKLLGISKELNKDEKKFIPPYYSEAKLQKYITTWMRISEIEPIEASTISRLKAMNSVFQLEETLVRSSSGYFLVYESKNLY
jgi:hypothetical protein